MYNLLLWSHQSDEDAAEVEEAALVAYCVKYDKITKR